MKMDSIPAQPVIEAGRFALRPLRTSDAGLIALYAGDERVARNTASIPHPLPPGAAEAMVSRALAQDREADVWAIDGSATLGAELMGLVTLERLGHGHSEISFWVAPALWNSGVATAAVAALVAANPHKARTIVASVFQDSPASARVLTNCGFRYLGDAECFCVARGSTVPTWTYSLKLA